MLKKKKETTYLRLAYDINYVIQTRFCIVEAPWHGYSAAQELIWSERPAQLRTGRVGQIIPYLHVSAKILFPKSELLMTKLQKTKLWQGQDRSSILSHTQTQDKFN